MTLTVLDYGNPNPFGEIIGRPRNLAWPVNAYRVTLPKVSDNGDGLNPFERLILKLIDAGGARDMQILAKETCIPVDLVQCVLLRLRDKAFITEYNEIIQQNRENWKSKEENAADYVTALLFRERATGKILPFLHLLDNNNPLKKSKKEETYIRKIRYDDNYNNFAPKEYDVILALKMMTKRLLTFNVDTRLPQAYQIAIASEPENYYLDCPIAIQKSDGEFRIADPFGIGFSLVLENAFNCLLDREHSLSNWLMDWRQRLSNPMQDKQVEAKKEPFDNETNQGRYPHLVFNLRLWHNKQYRSIQKIYASLEWALFYACAQGQYDTAVSQLTFTKQSEHPVLLHTAAERLGLILPLHGFRQVWEGKLHDFLSGKADMSTLLSIALLMAEKDISHPFRRIASKYQDFVIRLFDIKKKRDAQGHGHGKNKILESELPEEIFMREIVTTLLPSIRFSDTPVAEIDKDDIADSLLDARTSIQNEFGFKRFNRLGMDLQDRLIHAECFWLSCKDGDDALTFACDIYAALQKTFRQTLFGALPPDIRDSEFSVMTQNKAIRSGLGQLPECLRTVNPIAIKTTLQGADQTLGACVIAFLLTSDDDTLRSVADIQPSFIADIAEIINRRGHGNECLFLPKDDIGKLRKAAYRTIKTLLEV